MKQSRRTKREMEWADNECRFYLLENRLDPHKAYEAFLKEHLIERKQMPYYIKGIKDFILAADKLKTQLNRNESQAQKEEENPVSKLEMITEDQYHTEIKPIFKQQEDKEVKISLVNLWSYIQSKSFKGITQQEIRHYKQLKII